MSQSSVDRTLTPSTAPATCLTPPLLHPTPCPPWCKDRDHRMAHRFGPTGTFHWSPEYTLNTPRPFDADSVVMLSAELCVGDEDDRQGEPTLYVRGDTDIDLSAAEADIFIINMQAFVDTLRVLRKQMDAA